MIAPPDFETYLARAGATAAAAPRSKGGSSSNGAAAWPPSLFVHMPRDKGMATKVADCLAALRRRGIPAGEVRVPPRPVTPLYFSFLSPRVVSAHLSVELHARLQRDGLLLPDRGAGSSSGLLAGGRG